MLTNELRVDHYIDHTDKPKRNLLKIVRTTTKKVDNLYFDSIIQPSEKGILRKQRKLEGKIRKIKKAITKQTGMNFVSYNGQLDGQGGSLGVLSFTFEKNGNLTEVQVK